jgi:hypothetical protein
MSSTIIDRSSGLGTGATPNGENATISVKVPVRVATTANITLAGEQTIDGVAVVADDRVLVKDQTDQTENGIYLASADAWARTTDCADNGDLVTGTEVRVNAGSTNTGRWYCSSADPIAIGTDNITWAQVTGIIIVDGDKGDVTVSSGGTVWTINASAVEFSMIEDVADMRVLGNVSGGAAAPAEVSILDEDDMNSDSATALSTQQSIKAFVEGKIVDEDDMASNSASLVPTQQSVKFYVDNNAPSGGATGVVEYVEFTASGSFTKASYPDAKSFEVIAQGPGGSGATADYSNGNGGGAGGAGGQAIKVFNPADLAASITVTINSSKAEFGHTTPVVGNAGSNGSGHTGGAGGSATGGDLNFAGARGEDGGDSNNSTATHGGNGGAPLGLYRLGAGGYRGDATNVANSSDLDGNNGQGYGGGGGGGSCNSSASGNGSGGSGAAGYVLVKVNY